MAIILQATDWEIPEPAVLNLPGLPVDPFGEILAGDLALWDFARADHPDTIGTGVSVPGLILGQEPATGGPTTAFTGINAAKGLVFDQELYTDRRLLLPYAYFDLNNLGSEASLMISTWLTHTGSVGTSNGIMGHCVQNSGQHQWSLLYESSNNISGAINSATTGNRFLTNVTTGEPTLLSLVARRSGDGVFERKLYKNGVFASQNSTPGVYPFNTPGSTTGNARPMIGRIAFGSGWKGTIHRLRLRKFDPAANIEAWLAAEVASNAGRFAGA